MVNKKRFKKGGLVPKQPEKIDEVLVTYIIARMAIMTMSLN